MSILSAVWDVVAEARKIATLSETQMFATVALRHPYEFNDIVREGNYEKIKDFMVRMCIQDEIYELLNRQELRDYCLSLGIKITRLTKTDLIYRLEQYDRFGKVEQPSQ